jgi:hypothetical protein
MASTSNAPGLPAPLRPPAGLVLASGILLAVLVSVLPGGESYSAGIPCLVGLTLICGALLAVGQIGTPPRVLSVRSEDLSTVSRIRDDLAARMRGLPEGNPLRAELADVIERMDREVIPRLTELIARHDDLGARLRAYDQAPSTRRPDASTLQRLRALFDRQTGVIQGLVQQTVTMEANLFGLTQEGDEQRTVKQVHDWAEEMDFRWQGMAEVLAEDPLPPTPKPR